MGRGAVSDLNPNQIIPILNSVVAAIDLNRFSKEPERFNGLGLFKRAYPESSDQLLP